MWRGLLRAGAIVSAGVFLGRIAGFLRDLLLANKLGVGPAADIAVYGLTLPDMFTNLFVGGAVGAVLVPEFKAAPAKARALCFRATLVTLLGFSLLAGLAALLGRALVSFLAPGFSPAAADAAVRLAEGTLLAVPLTAAAAVTTAYLQSRDRFAVPALGTLIFNCGILVALAVWVTPERLTPIAWGVVAAAALRWAPQLAQALGSKAPLESDAAGSEGGGLARRYLEALGSMGFVILAPFAARALASTLGEGAVAKINFSFKIVELPMALAVGGVVVALLPRFAELHAKGSTDETRTLARQGMWLSWVLALPAVFVLAVYGSPLSRLMFGHGRMPPEVAEEIGRLAVWSLPSLPAQGMAAILYVLLSGRRDTRRPFYCNVAAFGLYLLTAWAGREVLGLRGIMLATVALHWSLTFAYLFVLRRYHGLTLLSRDMLRDCGLGALAGAAAFAPAVLLAGPHSPPPLALAGAMIGGACALAAVLLLPSRVAPGGWRSLLRR